MVQEILNKIRLGIKKYAIVLLKFVPQYIAYHMLTIAIVMNTELLEMSATSVIVSWDRLDIPEIMGYIVYYSQTEIVATEQFVNVPSSQNSVLIEDLMTEVEYQFEVVAVAELDGDVLMGERSERVVVSGTDSSQGVFLLHACVCMILLAQSLHRHTATLHNICLHSIYSMQFVCVQLAPPLLWW